jgi:hypothetical protein
VLAVNLSVFHRQRAKRFAQLLDEAGHSRPQDLRSTDDQDLAGLVGVGQRLSRIDLHAQADPEFRTDLRAMLMATIERDGIGASAVEPEVSAEPARRPVAARSMISRIPVRSRRARGAVVVGLAVGTIAVAGMSAVSGDAKPGDALYGMKRSTERAQLALSGSEQGRGQLHLEFARTRTDEAAIGRSDVVAVLADMDDQTRQGVRLLTTAAVDRHDPSSLDTVDTFVAEQRHTLAGLLGSANGDARIRTIDSLQLLDQVQKRVDGLRDSLGCADLASATGDSLGPIPGTCAAKGSSPDSAKPAPTDVPPAHDGTTTAPEAGTAIISSAPTLGASMTRSAAASPSRTAPATGRQPDDAVADQLERLLGTG